MPESETRENNISFIKETIERNILTDEQIMNIVDMCTDRRDIVANIIEHSKEWAECRRFESGEDCIYFARIWITGTDKYIRHHNHDGVLSKSPKKNLCKLCGHNIPFLHAKYPTYRSTPNICPGSVIVKQLNVNHVYIMTLQDFNEQYYLFSTRK